MSSNSIRALAWLITGEARQHPGRIAIAVIAIAIGVALGFAVHLINGSALAAFGQAVNTVNGAADLKIEAASRLGFDEALYAKVLQVEGVADASPVVVLRAGVARGEPFTLLGLDIIRAAEVTPSLIGAPASGPGGGKQGGGGDDVFASDALFLSQAALIAGKLRIGDRVTINANGQVHPMTVRGLLPAIAEGRRVGMMDIAAAQWLFGRLGRIDRIDLKLTSDVQAGDVRARLRPLIPADAIVSDQNDDAQQSDGLSRAYRVNLTMLALVALFTGTFLVYSTQSLSVTRRLQSFALLRTIGMQRSGIVALVTIEGALAGLIGATFGLLIGFGLAAGGLDILGGDLGSGIFDGAPPALILAPLAAAGFFALGVAAAVGGSLIPALQGARAAPAVALRNAGDSIDPRDHLAGWLPLTLLIAGIGAALMPAVGRLPLFGYLSVALLLAAGITAMPWLAGALLAPLARALHRNVPTDLAIQHLHGAPSAAATALCGIVASTALMIAMAVMVTSFRGAVDQWLGDILSGDLYVRSEPGWGGFDQGSQARMEAIPGIASIAFSRQVPIVLDPSEPPMSLIARPVGTDGAALELLGEETMPPPGITAVWLSEPAARILAAEPGDAIRLPIGTGARFAVAGIWRDYSRQQGAVVIDSSDYDRLTGDTVRDDAMVLLEPGADLKVVRRAIRAAAPPPLKSRLTMAEPASLRTLALSIFDRSFAITYVLEAIAVIVGLAGVATTASAQASARTREFGMLRHIGVGRGQIVAMLGIEGALLGAVGGLVGVTLGVAISQVLIHVINPQSFNWTMTTRLPVTLMLSVITALIVSSAITAMLAGRRAASMDAVRAVRADW
ncbi:MAG: ABC transporter permease [Blastomonas sp.]|uniref:FtsX-like permease family protein n=1 Tax=Blastomonas sp. TaxID=1909299 RepID=UPI002589D08B|nr:ABC transporter permease [Blastomonas sp.]MCO5791902.1 ABC transporter permease [Blastomonas sp.]